MYASRWMEAQAEGRGPPPLSVGFTYELTAGIIDKNKSNAEIAKEEVGVNCSAHCWCASPRMKHLLALP